MSVLIVVASKHGATRGIAEAIRAGLEQRGIGAEVRAPEEVEALDGYDAVVVGSAVYVGHWMKSARRFVAQHEDALRERPVWLFSSGPLGADDPQPHEEPEPPQVPGARGHFVFAGKLDRGELNLAERATVHAVKAPYGDFRDPVAIDRLAAEVAADLAAVA
jgi:menaquinone-dependent protoporphyrinogen oxidase